MRSDEEELDESDIEVINAENVRIIVKRAGPSTAEVKENVQKNTRYRILRGHRKERFDRIVGAHYINNKL